MYGQIELGIGVKYNNYPYLNSSLEYEILNSKNGVFKVAYSLEK